MTKTDRKYTVGNTAMSGLFRVFAAIRKAMPRLRIDPSKAIVTASSVPILANLDSQKHARMLVMQSPIDQGKASTIPVFMMFQFSPIISATVM